MTDKNERAAMIAIGLNADQQSRVRSFSASPRQMGIGMSHYLPDLVKPDGFDHPIFGPHYSLTELGLAVRDHLTQQEKQP